MLKNAKNTRLHLDKRFLAQNNHNFIAPHKGWIRSIREALGMTQGQLASRLDVSTARVSKIEKEEVRGTLKIETLERVAHALGCKFTYQISPLSTLEDQLGMRARRYAEALLNRIDTTMLLEDQLPSKLEKRLNDMIEELMEETPSVLWDLPDE